jgi:hypothetical protein
MLSAFPRQYEIDERPGYPERYEHPVLNFEATLSLGQASSEVAELLFFPNSGGYWRGRFRVGMSSCPTLVSTTPNSEDCLVVAGGIAYLVNVAQKTADHIYMNYPITQIVEAPASELLIIADFSDIAALGSAGLRWKEHLVADDLRILSINQNTLRYQGFDRGETWEYVAEIQPNGLGVVQRVSPAAS